MFGTDAGAFPWSMNPAAEAKLMVDAGMSPAAVVRALTSSARRAARSAVPARRGDVRALRTSA